MTVDPSTPIAVLFDEFDEAVAIFMTQVLDMKREIQAHYWYDGMLREERFHEKQERRLFEPACTEVVVPKKLLMRDADVLRGEVRILYAPISVPIPQDMSDFLKLNQPNKYDAHRGWQDLCIADNGVKYDRRLNCPSELEFKATRLVQKNVCWPVQITVLFRNNTGKGKAYVLGPMHLIRQEVDGTVVLSSVMGTGQVKILEAQVD